MTDATVKEDDKRTRAPELPAPPHLPGVVIGRLLGYERGQPKVEYDGNPTSAGVVARAAIPLTVVNIGGEVVLAFENGNWEKPVVLGLLTQSDTDHVNASAVDVQIDGERLLLTAKREIVLRSGEATITLTHAGKVMIKGAYVLSCSSGANRVKGGSVQIN